MKRATAVLIGVLGAMLSVSVVLAGPPHTGTTELLDAPAAGATIEVEVSVTSVAPVVPYGYAIQNECKLPARGGSTYQRDDIVYWTFEEDGVPHATMDIDLGPVPSGSSCQVFLVRDNTAVKGSTTSYDVP